jgi:glycosyltransferase involved in cell wall biosynthesis
MNQAVPIGNVTVSGILHDLSPDLPPSSLRNIDQWLLRSTVLFCVSQFTAKQLYRRLSPERLAAVYVIPPCPRYSHQLTDPPLSPSFVKPSFLLSPTASLRCFMPATLQERKGHHVLLEAACRASEKGLRLTITFVGSCTEFLRGLTIPNTDHESNLLDLLTEARSLGVHIDALGHVDESTYAELLTTNDVVVFPSLYEGFGLPLSESISAGIPVIASDLPPIREQLDLFDCHDRAILVPAGNPTDLAIALCRFARDCRPSRVDPYMLTPNFMRWTWAMAAEKIISTLNHSIVKER